SSRQHPPRRSPAAARPVSRAAPRPCSALAPDGSRSPAGPAASSPARRPPRTPPDRGARPQPGAMTSGNALIRSSWGARAGARTDAACRTLLVGRLRGLGPGRLALPLALEVLGGRVLGLRFLVDERLGEEAGRDRSRVGRVGVLRAL